MDIIRSTKKYAIVIAPMIVNECLDNGLTINTSKLMKLLYFMQKLHLKKYKEPMFSDRIIATPSGPIIEGLNDVFVIGRLEFKHKFDSEIVFMESHEEVFYTILENFGHISPSELLKLSENDEAYQITYDNGKGDKSVIPLELISYTEIPFPIIEKNKKQKTNIKKHT